MLQTVLIVIKHFNFGGTERYAINLANALSERNITVILIGDKGPLAKYINPKVKVFFAPIGRESKNKIKSEKIIKKIAEKYKPQIIYTQCRNSLLCCQMTRNMLRIPIISHDHLSYRDSEYPFVVDEFKRHTDRLITIGPNLTKKMISFGYEKNKITTFMNGLNIQDFPLFTKEEKIKARKSLRLFTTDKVILCLSRIVPGKNIENLLEAFIIVAQKIPNAKLVIAGDDEWNITKPQIKAKIKEYNLTKKVLFFPGQFNIRKFHAVADIFCYPPISKGMAVLEAMASSLPIVAKKASVKPFLVENEISGLLTKTSNAEELAEKLIYLLEHPRIAKKMGAAARQTVEENYTLDDIVNNLLALYDEVKITAEISPRNNFIPPILSIPSVVSMSTLNL